MPILFPPYNPFWIYYPLIAALAYLATWRGFMRQYGQIYSLGTLLPANQSGIDCSTGFNTKYRTLEGVCNDFEYPQMGATGTRFNRHTGLIRDQPQLSYPENDTRLLSPNPRDVARDLLHETDERPRVAAESLNLLVAAWIQFMIHDWTHHANSKDPADYIKIPLSKDDPLYDAYGPDEQYMSVEGTAKDPTYGSQPGDTNRPQTFKNSHTAWWDANQIYGVDQSTNQKVRDPNDSAKLKLDRDEKKQEYRLPTDDVGEVTGFRENWWLGLSLLHNLFAMEHNHIVDELRKFDAAKGNEAVNYSNDELYNIARLIISALLAKIHTIEWTPAILDNDLGDIGLRTNWYGFEYGWFQSLYDGVYLDTNQYSLLNQLLAVIGADPVKGGTRNLYGANYQFTEAFVAVYRLHPLLPDKIKLRCIIDEECGNKRRFKLDEVLNEQTVEINNNFYQNDLFYTFGTNHPNALFLNGYSDVITDLNIDGDRIDLATIDLLRQRERGVPRYNDFRNAMGMPKLSSYAELTDDTDLIQRVSKHYPNINDMDLLIGMFLENEGGKRVPNGWIFGETQFAVFLESASRRLKADRFFTDCYTAEYYTDFGLHYIELNTFKDILTRHFPKLKDYVPSNPFFAWKSQREKEREDKMNEQSPFVPQNIVNNKYVPSNPEEHKNGTYDIYISQPWLYLMVIGLIILIIGNIFCLRINGKSWNHWQTNKYSKVKIVASSDEDLSAVDEVNID